ncbi:helix-turn-helix domain-containing protein [Natronorubrum sulfidifaciens]|uniref:Bacterio-opsin activator HTH domain-containing protein n=1 Tax=Natronorubrum sulfidifaciens JCM 14089 TaxID=1230460 RepID=L9WDC3_9EURY|nr:helix-turn-helix domain-containing protein [Natronorubrum sulfidifaciens]ELY47480.1 Bacterio-opsin activator HTH domain-containing protein [Natronorubrum sulfidifaciens JCM 14089]
MSGFRATVVVNEPTDCPVADVSATIDEPISSVARSRTATDGTVTEEFGVTAGSSTEAVSDGSGTELTTLQTTTHEDVYRFERDAGTGCACDIIEQTGTPVASVRAQNGSLLLTFRTLELERVSEIVGDLRAQFDGVLVEDLTQGEDESTDPVIVDRELLTTRQREIIETAHECGYFEYPKGANATDVADELDIARSTFTEHLAAAQTKLMAAILEK